jgi:hypothetical protein
MAYRKHFDDELRRRYPSAFGAIIAEIEARYRANYPDIAFARNSSNPVDRRLDFCAYFLATIQTLEARGAVFDEIREVCLAVTEAYVRPANAWQRWLKRLPARLMGTIWMRPVVRIMAAKAGKQSHADGFLARIVTDPAETYGLGYGIDILACGIVNFFRKHGAAHYVPILCEVDRLTSSLAGLELVRQGTIANGATKCDFRFKIAKKGHS